MSIVPLYPKFWNNFLMLKEKTVPVHHAMKSYRGVTVSIYIYDFRALCWALAAFSVS
jgi:hypothetical protein